MISFPYKFLSVCRPIALWLHKNRNGLSADLGHFWTWQFERSRLDVGTQNVNRITSYIRIMYIINRIIILYRLSYVFRYTRTLARFQ